MKSLPGYLKNDLPASLAVFFVAIPLCLGIAHASGAPLISGLITGAVGGIFVGIISKSPLSVSGPAAGLTAIVAGAIQQLGGFDYFLVAICLSGVLQFLLGAFRLGKVAHYIPEYVIKGMLSAIGVLLIIKQLPHLIGYDIEAMGLEAFYVVQQNITATYHSLQDTESNALSVFFHSFQHIEAGVFLIGLISMAILIMWENVIGSKLRIIPGSLLVVLTGIALQVAFRSNILLSLTADHLVNVPLVSDWNIFLQSTTLPNWEGLMNPAVYQIAVTLTLVASIETLLSLEAIDKLDPWKRKSPPNRELMAQGSGNIAAAMLGGIPMTAVIVRGSVNIAAGAQTKISTILHGILIVLAVVFFAGIMNLIPLASLASVLVFTGYKLINLSRFRYYYTQGAHRFIPFVITLAAIVISNLLYGVFIGCVSAAVCTYLHALRTPLHVRKTDTHMRIYLTESVPFLTFKQLLSQLDVAKPDSIIEIHVAPALHKNRFVTYTVKSFRQAAVERNIRVVRYDAESMPDSA